MAALDQSGAKAELDDIRLRDMERRHLALAPYGERAELRPTFALGGVAAGIAFGAGSLFHA